MRRRQEVQVRLRYCIRRAGRTSKNNRVFTFTYAAASGSPRATSSSFFLSVFGNKPNMMQCFLVVLWLIE